MAAAAVQDARNEEARMKKVNAGNFNFSMCIVEAVIGVLLLIDPIGFTSGIIVTLGILAVIWGIGQIISYFMVSPEDAVKGGKLTKGILLTVFGFFCAAKSEWFLVTFPVITVLYGVLALVIGVGKLQQTANMARMKQKYWYITLISAVLTILFAVIIILNPFASTAIHWVFIGVTMLVDAVMDLVTFIFAKIARKNRVN